MNRKRRKPQTLIVYLVCIILALVACALYLWGTLKPAWLPVYPWLQTVGVVLGVLAVAIPVLGGLISDIILPFIDRSAQPQAPAVADLLEQAPIRRVDYAVLIARLGRSGKIPWIDRGITTPSLLQSHGRIAIVGPMKSGKTREAYELSRMAQENGLVCVLFEPTATLDLIEQEHLSAAVAAQVDQRCLLLIDDLGLRQDDAYLERLSLCIESVARSRPDAYFLVTLQQERLSAPIRSWIEKHRFYAVTPPVLTADQRLQLAETGRVTLAAAVMPQAVAELGKDAKITKPWDIVSVLQAAPTQNSGKPPLTETALRTLLARGEQDLWAEQRREIIEATPAAEPLLRSIGVYFSAGVTPRLSSILRYAAVLTPSRLRERKKQLALRLAADRLQRYDIIASDGLYAIPEPRLLPLLIETEQARADLKGFATSYRPGFWTSLTLTLLWPLDFLFQSLRSLASRFSFIAMLQKRWNALMNRLPFKNTRWPCLFRRVSDAVARLADSLFAWLLLPLLDKVLVAVLRLAGSLFAWPADRALLQLELGNPGSQPTYLSSTLLVERGLLAMGSGANPAALDYFDSAIALDPRNPAAHNDRGCVYLIMGQYEMALADFDQAIVLFPKRAYYHKNRSVTLRKMKRYEEALAAVDQAIALDPKDAWSCLLRGRLYQNMSQFEQALSDTNRALEINPEDDWFIYCHAVVLLASGKTSLAQTDLAIAIRLAQTRYGRQSTNWQNTFNLALYHLANSEPAEAERLYREGIGGNATPAHIRDAIDDLDDLANVVPDSEGVRAVQALLTSARPSDPIDGKE